MNRKKIGDWGEALAKEFLERQGIQIIESNYFSKFGEIDLIGIENETIIFIEVKTRRSDRYGEALEAINAGKWSRLNLAVMEYLGLHKKEDSDCRIDLVTIQKNSGSQLYKIDWVKNINFC